MKLFRALALTALVTFTGCQGFVPAVRHAVTGYEPTPEEKAKQGYDTTVVLTNLLLTLTGYAARHFQDKVIPKKQPPEVK